MEEVQYPHYELLAWNEQTINHAAAMTQLLVFATVQCRAYSQITTQLFADHHKKQNNAEYRHILATLCFTNLSCVYYNVLLCDVPYFKDYRSVRANISFVFLINFNVNLRNFAITFLNSE